MDGIRFYTEVHKCPTMAIVEHRREIKNFSLAPHPLDHFCMMER